MTLIEREETRESFRIPASMDLLAPVGASGKEPTCQSRRHKRHEFDPWVEKIAWRRKWQPIFAWRIPWTEEPAIGSQRIGHD